MNKAKYPYDLLHDGWTLEDIAERLRLPIFSSTKGQAEQSSNEKQWQTLSPLGSNRGLLIILTIMAFSMMVLMMTMMMTMMIMMMRTMRGEHGDALDDYGAISVIRKNHRLSVVFWC